MTVVAFDTETHLIEPGLKAPPLVCLQWRAQGAPNAAMLHRDGGAKRIIQGYLEGDEVLVGHNVAYDMAVIGAQWPDLMPLIFAKYDRDQVTDTKIRDQLLNIARGTFKFIQKGDGEAEVVNYSLQNCIARHFGRWLPKEGWRLFYRAFDDVPDILDWSTVASEFQIEVRKNKVGWVCDYLEQGLLKKADVDGMLAARLEEAVSYALDDATNTLELYESQERISLEKPGVLDDQFRQARAAFGTHLSSCWGVHTAPEAVDVLEAGLRDEYEALKFELQQEGIIRADGSADTKAAMAAMVQACEEEGLPVMMTKGGKKGQPKPSLSAEACDRFDDTTVIGRYSRFLTVRKTLTNDIVMLRSGCDTPIQPNYGLAETGRITCAEPNITAVNRGAGIREAFRPRPGTYFIQADFEGLELNTRAAWCLEVIGWSKLAEDLNAGLDVHCVVAADLLGESYEYVYGVVKGKIKVSDAEKKRCKDARQASKALNFGLPGGLGVKKFVRYAWNSFQVRLEESDAAKYKVQWLQRQPEVLEFYRLAAAATNNPDKVGDEETLFTRRYGGSMRYAALCNRRFQGLGADAAKEALWRVTRACYVEPESPLFGCRVVAFVHDEIIAEAPCARASDAAKELSRVMCEGANKYLHRVPVKAPPAVMTQWSKNAEAVYAEDGVTLLPWMPKAA